MINYGFYKEVAMVFEEAVEIVTEELKKEGFGILTKIDVRDKFKEKLDIDFKKYVILGACNPLSAHKAILAEENIGLMLPCNVIVYKKEKKTAISIIKPTIAMKMIDNEELKVVLLYYSALCVPSQNPGLLVALQVHIYAVFVDSAVNTFGVNEDPLCAPSQKGWFEDSPQLHQAYTFPSSSSTGIGALPAILGSGIVVSLGYRTIRQNQMPNCLKPLTFAISNS